MPKNVSRMAKLSPGQPNCNRKKMDNMTATIPMNTAVIRNCFEIILWSCEKMNFETKDSSW